MAMRGPKWSRFSTSSSDLAPIILVSRRFSSDFGSVMLIHGSLHVTGQTTALSSERRSPTRR
jgi:hypothetical protein